MGHKVLAANEIWGRQGGPLATPLHDKLKWQHHARTLNLYQKSVSPDKADGWWGLQHRHQAANAPVWSYTVLTDPEAQASQTC